MSTGGQASPQLVPRIVDGLTIQTTEHGAQVIDRLQAQLSDAKSKAETAEAALATANTAHATALEAKDGEIAGLKAQLSDEELDKRATERGDLIATVTSVLGSDYNPAGKTNVQLMTDCLTKVYSAEVVKDRSPEYISGLFATVKAKTDDKRDTVRSEVADHLNGTRQPSPRRDVKDGKQLSGRDAYLQRLSAGRQDPSQHRGN